MMSTTPGKGRSSNIPTPGKSSGIPTPGRFRSASSTGQYPQPSRQEDEFMHTALVDAIKANDPAQHRPARNSDISLSSSLSLSTTGYPGRRSVATRPASSTPSTSALATTRAPAAYAREPAARPASRQSDAFVRSASRAGRPFDIGDNVRIESLGFEGTLRYLGEIDGKSGLWAGVELSGGFTGKGKNNGAVNGKQYFSCPPNCGVFIASNKLSPPTVGYSRPSSVASSRNGRATPSLSGRVTPSASVSVSTGRKTPSISMPNHGRVTPSFANGRVTPSLTNGRVTPSASMGRKTPGIAPPTIRPRNVSNYPQMNAVTPTKSVPAVVDTTITPGSRASKYVGMTAKQLTSRSATGAVSPTRRGAASPPRKSMGSPTRAVDLSSPPLSAHPLPSPSRTTGSPFGTPKAGRVLGIGVPSAASSKGRTSIGAPRARLPSAVAMPPPQSPSLFSRSVSLNDPPPHDHNAPAPLADLETNGRALQEKIAALLSGGATSSSTQEKVARPDSSASVGSNYAPLSDRTLELQAQLDTLRTQLDGLENENQRLRAIGKTESAENSRILEALQADRSELRSRISELEAQVRTTERTLSERENTIEALERAAQQTTLDIDKVRGDADVRIRDVQSKLDDKEALVSNLKALIEAKEGLESENDAVISAKNAEIELLEARVAKAYTEMEEERRELGGQVDELRKAGQETIALYEERLSAADSKRYEMEDLIASLEEQLRAQFRPLSPSTLAKNAASAAEIDNEALRDQIQHLQRKISTLEDALEDARVLAEREELAVHDRIRRYREKEESLRKELQEGQDEAAKISQAEEGARHRVEEIEEALRENTVALENARAEIEGLRNEIADLESVKAGASASSERLADAAQRTASERSRLQEEISQLKQQLARANAGAPQSTELQELVEALDADKAALEDLCQEREAELDSERKVVAELRRTLEERSSELEMVRKKMNRDVPMNGVSEGGRSTPSSPSKHDYNTAREEITGLKHIVQELQKEITAATQRNRLLEAENKLLLSETEQLREDLKILEDNVEQSLLREEQALDSPSMVSDDIVTLQKKLRDLKKKYEAELEQVRKRQSETEMKSARTIHDLNKEIGELESLIESKIYREDELERELDRLKEKLARSQKRMAKGEAAESPTTTRFPMAHASAGSTSTTHSQTQPAGPGAEEVCEICERPGHDIFTCDLLKGDAGARPPSVASMGSASTSLSAAELVCEDCEERGHVAADCPHSLDVF